MAVFSRSRTPGNGQAGRPPRFSLAGSRMPAPGERSPRGNRRRMSRYLQPRRRRTAALLCARAHPRHRSCHGRGRRAAGPPVRLQPPHAIGQDRCRRARAARSPAVQAAPQAGPGRRGAGLARGLPGRCQCLNPAKAASRRPGAAAFTAVQGLFLRSATDYPLCAVTTPESQRLRTAQNGGYRTSSGGQRKLQSVTGRRRLAPDAPCRFWPVGDRIRGASVRTQMTLFWVAVRLSARMDGLCYDPQRP